MEKINKYNPKEIELKWQKYWGKNPELVNASEFTDKPKKFILDMFPYPSGAGLHVGHVESYTATDIYSRYLRMKGFNVLHPQGFDAFGLPAENYAVKTGVHPQKTTQQAIKIFKRQINSLGFSYDWGREVNSSDPEYYKWTQWFFLLLYKNGLAYKKKAKVNWCPKCQTVLANEQSEGGKCERCESEVTQKDLEQWFFKITDFVEDTPRPDPLFGKERELTRGLLSGLDNVDWPESTKLLQKNWIGKSEGAIVKFQITNDKSQNSNDQKFIEVFTTRVDTIFGCTYVILAPESKLANELKEQSENKKEIENYISETQKKTDLERMENKEKTGIEMRGIKAINPFNSEEIPVYVADYVIGTYGTGAVMAVPAHDERDFEFAKKYKLPIKKTVEPKFVANSGLSEVRPDMEFKKRNAVAAVVRNPKDNTYLCVSWKAFLMHGLVTGGINDGEEIEKAARREVLEETGYKNLKLIKIPDVAIHSLFYHRVKKENRWARFQFLFFDLENDEQENIKEKEKKLHEVLWIEKEKLKDFFSVIEGKFIANFFEKPDYVFTNDGILNVSGEYSGLDSQVAREKMTAWLEESNLGQKKINYKLRDWLVSRQRYWGAPIPIIYCKKCGEVPVPEKDLPVILPNDVDFKPTGESPLKYSEKFQNVKCPQCGGTASRESDTMDTFVCSSWYYLRYSDSKNNKEFAAKEKLEKWLPVDLYVGGAEHTVLHLLYARFFTKVLHHLGYLNFDEPFLKLRHQGTILAEDGTKMSKSKGNVVNPDDVVKRFGADALRCFEMFMGPLEDSKPWQTKGIVGIYRFLERAYNLRLRCRISYNDSSEAIAKNTKLNILINKTIKKVSEDIENMKFNTAISQLMILTNALEKQKKINKVDYLIYLVLLSPFAPHLAEELWEKMGHGKSIFLEKWPTYDAKIIQDEKFQMIIQINGKMRDGFLIDADISEEDAKGKALKREKVQKFIVGKEIKKVIFVRGRLINIVV